MKSLGLGHAAVPCTSTSRCRCRAARRSPATTWSTKPTARSMPTAATRCWSAMRSMRRTTSPASTPRQTAEDRRLVGQHGRPRQAARHRPLLRHRRQQPGLLLRLDRARCMSTRPPASPTARTFPVVTVEDWVDAQARLVDALGIAQFAAVMGGSLGGMQALSWTLLLPGAAAPLRGGRHRAQPVGAEHRLQRSGAPGHRHRPRLPRRPLLRARRGAQRGLRVARMIGHITYLSRRRRWREIRPRTALRRMTQFGYGIDFEIECYLRYQGDKFCRILRRQHLSADHPGARLLRPGARVRRQPDRGAAPCARASSCWCRFTTDWRFAPARSREIVQGAARQPPPRELCRDRRAARPRRLPARRRALHGRVRAYYNRVWRELETGVQSAAKA